MSNILMTVFKPSELDSVDDLELCSVRKIARKLDCSHQHVYDLINNGELPAIKFSERRILVPEQAFLEWLDTKTIMDTA